MIQARPSTAKPLAAFTGRRTAAAAPRIVVARAKFNFPELTRSAVRSKLTYEDPEVVAKLWKEAQDPDTVITDDNIYDMTELKGVEREPLYVTSHLSTGQDAQAYIWSKDKKLYITFRGTHGMADIKADADGLKTTAISGDIRVHCGFFKQFKSIEQDIVDQIHAYDVITDIVFAGHSLGGGLAQIAAAYFGERYPHKNIVCHTFGGPRAGNVAFTEWFAKNVDSQTRVVNKNDPVPMVPQRSIWQHTAERCIVIDDDGKMTVLAQDVPWYLRWYNSLRDVDFRGLIKDHDIMLYVNRLNKLSSA